MAIHRKKPPTINAGICTGRTSMNSRMQVEEMYQIKLTSPENAVAALRSDSSIALGMAMSQPPALLEAHVAKSS